MSYKLKVCDLSFGCYLIVVVVCRLSGNVSTPQRSTDQTVGHDHHQQREQVDQQYHYILITAEGERADDELTLYIW